MPTAYWGVTETIGLSAPGNWQQWMLILVYLLLCIALLYRGRANLQLFGWQQWLGWLGLGVAAMFTGQFLPVVWRLGLLPLAGNIDEYFTVYLLAAVPALLAGLVLGPAPALLVGMSMGLGRAFAQSHQPVDIFHYALAAWLAASLMHLDYRGRLYHLLRLPPVSGALGFGAIALMTAVELLVLQSGQILFGRLDMAAAAVRSSVIPLLAEGFAGGLVVAMVALVKPAWRTGKELRPSPSQRSVRAYLLSNLLFFVAAAALLVSSGTVILSTYLSTRAAVAEMAAGAVSASTELDDLQLQMAGALSAYGDTGAGGEASKELDRALSNIYQQEGHYEQVIMVDSQGHVAETYPAAAGTIALSDAEQAAVKEALGRSAESLVIGESTTNHSDVSLVVPVDSSDTDSPIVLIGRLSEDALKSLLSEVSATRQDVAGAVLDAKGNVISFSRAKDGSFDAPIMVGRKRPVAATAPGGTAVLSEQEDGTRQLVFTTLPGQGNLRVLAAVPYHSVLAEGVKAAFPLVLLLLTVAGVFYWRLSSYSRDLTRTISQMTRSTRALSLGTPGTPAPSTGRPDELGELSRAFLDMEKGVRLRLEEQSLLLSVAREASSSVDLAESMPVILNGILRVTGASGARALTLNPSGGKPLTFAAGPSADNMALLDQRLLTKLRAREVLDLPSTVAIAEGLDSTNAAQAGIQSLYANQLQSKGRFLGFLVAGFRQPGKVGEKEREQLRSLAEQASVLLEKSYQFTHAESGRRRLAAILASTTEAVIVTDPTARVLMVNRAMEEAFRIQAREVVNRLVSDVIDSARLSSALAGDGRSRDQIEVTAVDGKTYLASVSEITNQDRQILGRVAVLHDITHQKEMDRLKSEFVDNVSHDLRTPLTILSGYASGLSLMDDLTDEQRLYTDKILQSVEQMIGLVENLLDLGRIEAGVDLVFEELDLAVLLQEIADEHWLFAHESGIKLHTRVQDGLPLLHADNKLLRQAIANLLTNGFKYAPNSGPMTLAADLAVDRQEIVISVRDRGPGIDYDDQKRVFEKFFRVKRHGSKAKGSGLGLAMVKSIAERHGGHVWCESEPGKGSTFYIAIPLPESPGTSV